MKPKLLFSIIIPLYNKQDYISETISSVLHQEETDFEIIIIDDGSTDNSYKIASSFNDSRIKLFTQDNQGVSTARNQGIKKSTGQFITMLDGDDYWYSNHLSEFKKSIIRCPKQVIFCNNYKIQLTNKILKSTSFSYIPNTKDIVLIKDYFRSSLLDAIAWTSAICISKDIFKKGYLFDTSINSGEDTELWIRIGLEYSFVFNKKATAIYRKNISNSLSKSDQLKARLKILYRFEEEEKTNIYLKKYMDLNRFSLAIAYKIKHNIETFKEIESAIALDNLHPNQRFLLRCNPIILKSLYFLKNKFLQLGIQLSSFK